jgi:hypothetical protein
MLIEYRDRPLPPYINTAALLSIHPQQSKAGFFTVDVDRILDTCIINLLSDAHQHFMKNMKVIRILQTPSFSSPFF